MLGGRYYYLPSSDLNDFLLLRPSDASLEKTFIQAFAKQFKRPKRILMKTVYQSKSAFEGLSQEQLEEGALLDDIVALGVKAGLTVGKWMMYFDLASIDQAWERLVRLVVETDDFEDVSIKVSTKQLADAHKRHPGVFTICMYVCDGIEKRERCFEVLRLLKQKAPEIIAAQKDVIAFKPDIMTELHLSGPTHLWRCKTAELEID